MRYKIILPDYENSLLNLMAAIKEYYHLDNQFTPLSLCQPLLQDHFKNVVLVVLDGLGSAVLDTCFPNKDSFLHASKKGDFISTFPSTTTAAITTLLSTKAPSETAWIGWHQFFKEIDQDLILFKNRGYYDENYQPSYPVAPSALPYEDIFSMLKKENIRTEMIYPKWHEKGVEDFPAFCKQISTYCQQPQEKFIYAYWDEPDSSLHQFGVGSKPVKQLVQKLDKELQSLYENLPASSLVLVIADHGHINVKGINLYKDQDLCAMLTHLPSVESRATAFFVKPEYRFLFRQVFNRRYGRHFKLLTPHEIMRLGLLGPGEPHVRLFDFLGDYVAIATDCYCFYYKASKQKQKIFKSTHAGLTKQEMVIPLIGFFKK